MFDNLFGKKKEEEEQKKIAENMQNMSEQIGALQKQLAEKTKEADSLRTQASQAPGAASALKDAQAQLEALRTQLAEAKKQQTSVGQKPVETRPADTSSAPAAGGAKVGAGVSSTPASSTPAAGGLVIGASAWVTRAGGLPLRLRAGPGLNEKILGKLPPGTSMTLKEGPHQADGHGWWHIRTSDGREGWVAGEDLRDKPD